MNSHQCFVPICENTTGVPFPKQDDLKQKWIEALKVENAIPTDSSFVCLDHFEDADLVEGAQDEDPINRIKPDAVPKLKLEPECHESAQNEEDDGDSPDNGDSLVEENVNFELVEEQSPDNEAQAEATDEETIENIQSFINEGSVCRLCMKSEGLEKNLNDVLCDVVLVKTAILDCLHPLKVTEEDGLPQSVCTQCLETLKICYEFRTICFQTDKRLQKNKSGDNMKRTLDHEDEPDKKRTRFEERHKYAEKGIMIKQEIVHDRSEGSAIGDSQTCRDLDSNTAGVGDSKAGILSILEDQSQDGSSLYTKVTTQNDNSDSTVAAISSSPPPLIPITQPQTGIVTGISLPKQVKIAQVKPPSDNKYKDVEEELRRVLEGSLSKDMMLADNIIIEVQSDEEDSNHSHQMRAHRSLEKSVKKLKLPLTIKSEKKPSPLVEKIVFPRGIRVSKFQSEVGMFPCSIVKGLYETEFCQADGYLFEYRLCKGRVRYLRCIVPTCPALGHQNQLPSGLYEKRVAVKMSHNHEPPSRAEMKKQMFYYVMKRKMQNDRTLNFRTVYETVCRIDPEIKTLVPLRNVINEICRHQLSYKLPVIRTFDEFYSLVEEDVFQKLHFTHNGKQFYQEKFSVDDESKAVVFANQETIRAMSSSKLMYVDASFKIDTQESFRYQLVTVLVWVEDSYYPIMYALVSKRSQEIFRKIFQYLHDTLAPNLRPEEIVTDYEANLYYALGETYVGSHIGGSCFYYTQNLYKKICSLNLSRELETSSFFRNIYHMLLMLPLLPVNTILDGLNNIEAQAREIGLASLTKPLFEHVRSQWIMKVTPELFCVHRLENRINENVIAPFKKLRDFLMLTKGKIQRQPSTIITVVEKIIELEAFLRITYGNKNKKSFARDLSSSQKKNVIRAWMYIENHPKININNFFTKVLGYIRCMENQLWIWGFYRYGGDTEDDLINAVNFSIVNSNDAEVVEGDEMVVDEFEGEDGTQYVYAEIADESQDSIEGNTVVMEAVIDEDGEFVLTEPSGAIELENSDQIDIVEESLQEQPGPSEVPEGSSHYENAYLKYVYRE